MAKRTAKRIRRDFTPEERALWARGVAESEANQAAILQQGRAAKAAQRASRDVLLPSRAERERQGLSLADAMQRTGMTREAISRLENDATPNPPVRTLARYAGALGLQLLLTANIAR